MQLRHPSVDRISQAEFKLSARSIARMVLCNIYAVNWLIKGLFARCSVVKTGYMTRNAAFTTVSNPGLKYGLFLGDIGLLMTPGIDVLSSASCFTVFYYGDQENGFY
ncbi:MAG: hypothetical protein ACU836_03090 [Gammaproteobacteria bacterium]